MSTSRDIVHAAGREPHRDGPSGSARLANELLLEIFQHIIPGGLFTEEECRKIYLALTGTSFFFASIVTARRFRHITSATSNFFHERRNQSLDWIPLVDAGDRAALAVAQYVVTMTLDAIPSLALRLALFQAWQRMPRLRSLELIGWMVRLDTFDAISRLKNLASLELIRCNLMENVISHIRPLRVPTFSLVPSCSWGSDTPAEQRDLASLVDTTVLCVLHAPALALSTWSLQSCAFPVLRKVGIELPRDYSADLQQAVCAFLTSAVALETLQICDNAEVPWPWDLSVPSTALTRLTDLEAPVHIFGSLVVGRPIRTLDVRENFDLPLGHMRNPGIMEVITRVEHLKISEDILVGVLPHASRLRALLVQTHVSFGQYHEFTDKLVSELTRASGTLRTLSIDTSGSYAQPWLNLSAQHGIVLQCVQSAPSLSEISLGSFFRWVAERVEGIQDVTEPAARVWRPRVVDKHKLNLMVTKFNAQEFVADFDGFLRRLYTQELATGAVDPWLAGFE